MKEFLRRVGYRKTFKLNSKTKIMIQFYNPTKLEEIAEINNILLLDSCAIFNHYSKQKGNCKDESYNQGNFIIESKGKYPMFITEQIRKEILDGTRIRKGKRKSKKDRKLKEIKKRNLKILNLLGVLELTNEELKNYERYLRICEKYSQNLSRQDLDLLVQGIIVAETRNSCGIISNDLGIYHSLSNIIGKGNSIKIKKENIHFYIRGEYIFNKMEL
jgi:hypothetical protein